MAKRGWEIQVNPKPTKRKLNKTRHSHRNYTNIFLTKVMSTFLTQLAPNKRSWIRVILILLGEKTALSKTILFLSLQVTHDKKRGTAFQSDLMLFLLGKLNQHRSKSLTLRGLTQGTPIKERRSVHCPQIGPHWSKLCSISSSSLPQKILGLTFSQSKLKVSYSIKPCTISNVTYIILLPLSTCSVLHNTNQKEKKIASCHQRTKSKNW